MRLIEPGNLNKPLVMLSRPNKGDVQRDGAPEQLAVTLVGWRLHLTQVARRSVILVRDRVSGTMDVTNRGVLSIGC